MKVLLINPLIREWAKPNVFPIGLGYIAAVLLKAGHEVEVYDINALRPSQKEVEEKLKANDYDAVGITGIITIYKYIKWLAVTLKKYHPDKKIIIGGGVGSSIPDIMLRNNPVDVVCIGEGELTAVELMDALEHGKDLGSVKGIYYKDSKGSIHNNGHREPIMDLDKIPLPAWDLFPMDIYVKNPIGAPNRNKWNDGASDSDILSFNLCGARGCPYQCIYCYHDFMGVKYRTRSPEYIISEIKTLYERHGITYFHFTDDEFVVKKDFVLKFCCLLNELSARIGKKLTWGCAGRVNLMDEPMIIAMKDAGCLSIGYGIESGSQKMLDFIKKHVTVEQSKKAVRLTQKHLGWADCSFMIGYPGETMETLKATVDFCKELGLTPEVIFFLTPYPGTELYELALKKGKIKDEEEYLLGLGEQGEKIRVNFTDFTDDELNKLQSDMITELGAWNKLKHPESR
ncbi:MAG: radical SAM protein [Elusimicrobiota bacterium]